ncbi:MAG TPA: tetratricopeptide repeat protein [Candidatus Edwardsbacteria bacterium]|nr:tetratricopeptide repeat protein [Candidatus Edwardsbacteria bacterium]
MRRTLAIFGMLLALLPPAAGLAQDSTGTVVAIMRFENLTGDSAMAWLGDGISETMTTKLSDVPGIVVIERLQLSQIMQEQALAQTGAIAESTAVKVGQLAGARTVVLGSVQRAGDQLRITARFVDVEHGTVAKSAEQTGAMAQLFTLEDQLALALLAAQGVAVNDSVRTQVQANPTASQPALQQSSMGDGALTAGNYDAAVGYYQQAVRLDPSYAQAHYQLGNAFAAQGKYNLATQQYRKVLTLRPRFADAHIRLAYIFKQQGLHRQAADEYAMALKVRPAYRALYQRHHGRKLQAGIKAKPEVRKCTTKRKERSKGN